MSFKRIAEVSSLAFFIALSGCGGSGGGGESSDGSSRIKLFKAVGGSNSEHFPLVGLRKYDNQTTIYSYWFGCQNEHDNTVSLHTASQDEPVDWENHSGPFSMGNGCVIDTKLIYSDGKLTIGGAFNGEALSVIMQEISEDEFKQLLKDDSLGLSSKYRSLSPLTQGQHDDACETLLGASCAEVFAN